MSRAASLVDEFLGRYFEFEPTSAAHMGLHEFDGRVPDYSPAALDARLRIAADILRRLDAEEEPPRGSLAWIDSRLLRRSLEATRFRIEELRWHERNPLFYSHGCDTSVYVKRRYAPLGVRARSLAEHLGRLPAFLDRARENLGRDGALARTRVETAINVFRGHVSFLEKDLLPQLEGLDAKGRDAVAARLADAVPALRGFVSFLEEQRRGAGESFAIGEACFRDLLRLEEGVEIDLGRLLELGEADLRRNREALEETARRLDPRKSTAEVLADMKREPPAAGELVPLARQILEDLRAFVVERDLVSIPDDQECRVEETPPFRRWAFAMLDAPGPYEQEAPDAFYYITPPEADWPAEKQREWLTQFERNTLTLVSVHEAWPGHFLHWLHFRNAPTAMTKFGDAYSFWEAWAHYAEELMLDEGYGAGDLRLRAAQLVEALIRNVRFVVAIRMHADAMTVGEAHRLFREHAFLEDAPALKEAERGTFDPGYLNYTLGKLLLKKLRADCREREGAAFRLRAFHDRFLSFGAPPLPLVRAMMLPEASGRVL